MPCKPCEHADRFGWWGQDGTHCRRESTALFALGDSDPVLAACRLAGSLERSPDGRWIAAQEPAYLDGAEAASIKRSDLFVIDQSMLPAMLGWGQRLQIQVRVVGLKTVRVVNMLALWEPGEEPVLVALDVALDADLPSKSHVSMARSISKRLTVGNCLARLENSDYAATFENFLPSLPASSAPFSPVADIVHDDSAVDAYFRGISLTHPSILACTVGCHRSWRSKREMHCACCRHFTTASACDLHLTGRGCVDPATVVHKKTKEPKLKLIERKSGPVWAWAGDRPQIARSARGSRV